MRSTILTLISVIFLGMSTAGYSMTDTENLCESRVTDRNQRIVEYMPKPAYMESYRDPAFGSAVTRISDAGPGQVVKTMYNTIQAWNADESRMILYHTGEGGAGHHLYNGQTYEHIRKLDIFPSDIEEIFWDPKSKNHLYYIQKYPVTDMYYDTLVRYNVETQGKQIITDLGAICGHPERAGGSATSGSDVQAMYADHIGVRCNNNAFNGDSTDKTFIVNVRTGEVSQQLVIDPSLSLFDNDFGYAYNIGVSPTPSNERVLLQGTVLDTELNLLENLDISYNGMFGEDGMSYPIPKPEHNSIGRLPDGQDAMFTVMYDAAEQGCNQDSGGGVGSLVSYNLETGNCKVIVGESNGWGYPLSGTHLSAISQDKPGWVAMSTIGYGKFNYFKNGKKAPRLFSEITLSYADENHPQTCRLAHTRTYAKDAKNINGYSYGYFGEPHPVISPSGTRILFSSDWYDSGSVDTYVIDLRVAAKESGHEGSVSGQNQDEDENTNPAHESASGTVSTSESSYIYGEVVYVDFANLPAYADNWVSIAPVDSPDSQMLMWLYTNGSQNLSDQSPQEGRLSFLSEYIGVGEFEARLFLAGSDQVSHRVRFTVEEITETKAEVSADKPVFYANENVLVHFSDASGDGMDWISIAPAGSPDSVMRMWIYTNGTQTPSAQSPENGSVSFISDYIGVGQFEARLFLNGSDTVAARAEFEISDIQPAGLSASKYTYAAGEDVWIHFDNTPGSGTDWISIAPAGSSDSEMLMWIYTHGSQSPFNESPQNGRVSFLSGYLGIGHFEARLFLHNSDTVSARVRFEISDRPEPAIKSTKQQYTAGEDVLIEFSGVLGSGRDWISIAPIGTEYSQMLMWIYTHGTQSPAVEGPDAGQVSFLSDYIGTGEFEARLFFNDSDRLEAVTRFTIHK